MTRAHHLHEPSYMVTERVQDARRRVVQELGQPRHRRQLERRRLRVPIARHAAHECLRGCRRRRHIDSGTLEPHDDRQGRRSMLNDLLLHFDAAKIDELRRG